MDDSTAMASAASNAPSAVPNLDSTPEGPELVFSLVRPVGIDREGFLTEFEAQLRNYGYEPYVLRVSTIIADYSEIEEDLDALREHERIEMSMDKGDEICRRYNSGAALAFFSISEIRDRRKLKTGSHDEPIRRIAYVIDSVKRPEEVHQLRYIYGDRYIQIGLNSSDANRRAYLDSDIRSSSYSFTELEIEKKVSELIDRDLRESDEYGQNVLKTFPQSDVFIDIDADVATQLRRLFDLLFGNPAYPVPTQDEFGMQLAYISSTRSAELGLKVGSAILDSEQRVLSLGANVHPIMREASPEFDHSSNEIGGLILDTLKMLSEEAFTDDAVSKLSVDPDSFVKELLAGPLKSAKIRDLIEFQPTVHAEMSALMDLVKRGISIGDATMYVTAYPCHGCAKHLVDLNIPVVYLEPYPKSRAASMYSERVVENFLPFIGIAPIRYESLFRVSKDRKGKDGRRMRWGRGEKMHAMPKVNLLVDKVGIVDREAAALLIIAEQDD